MANAKLQKQVLLLCSPFPMTAARAPSSYADRGPIARLQGSAAHPRHGHGHNQRTSSEIELHRGAAAVVARRPAQRPRDASGAATRPGWRGHRRSSSDSFALFDSARRRS
ncbi:bZIP transcription factor [Panicum miliaceum]|uniref:BZIP transcription factor n=1 Tax=Panicum miliaceum TaxID=4540 RepID=A0A3L6SKP1_PANMI|nr:bZIP transcription factor [Panicum miliaceum]